MISVLILVSLVYLVKHYWHTLLYILYVKVTNYVPNDDPNLSTFKSFLQSFIGKLIESGICTALQICVLFGVYN